MLHPVTEFLGRTAELHRIRRVRSLQHDSLKEIKAHRSIRARGCLLGLAVGDAVGTTLEFRSRAVLNPFMICWEVVLFI